MAIQFRLPTWNTEVDYWNYDAGTATYISGGTLTGQIYHAQRAQPGTLFGALYFMYPKEDDVLQDPAELGVDIWQGAIPFADIIRFEHPTASGLLVHYWVMQVHPRWLGFGNEHRCAYLKRMTPEEVDAALGGGGGVPDPVDPAQSTITAAPSAQEADGVATVTITLALKRASGNPAVGEGGAWSATGSAALASSTWTTNASGVATVTATNDVEESTTFSADPASAAVVGPSNAVEWTAGPPPSQPDYTVDFAGVANGSCSSCGDINGTHDLFLQDPDLWVGSSTFGCALGGSVNIFLFVDDTGPERIVYLVLTDTAGGGTIATWSASAPGWDGTTAIALNFGGEPEGYCSNWPATITASPVP